MAQVTLRELMNLEFTSSPSSDQIIAGLQFAKTSKIVQQFPPLLSAIDVALIALQTYQTVMQVYETIKSLKPLVNQATKIAGVPFNPGLLGEIASDAAELAANVAIKKIKEIPTKIIDSLLDYPLEI